MIFENVPRTYTEKWWKPLNYKTRSQLFSLPFDTLFPSKTVYIGYRKREDSSFLYSDLNLNVPSSKRTSSGSQWRRQWQPTPVLLPGKSHGWRSLVGCSPWGQKESDTTERLTKSATWEALVLLWISSLNHPAHQEAAQGRQNLLSTGTFFQRRQWHPTPVLLPGKSHGWRSLVGCCPWCCEELDWATSLSLFTFMHWRRKQQPTPVFLPGESQGLGSLVGCCLWGRTESDTTEVT